MTPLTTSQQPSNHNRDPVQDPDRTEPFARMMRLGQACYVQGARKQAHRYWRRAALIDPGNEDVWQALLNVVETDEDRQVCLQNILAINPHNKAVQAQLGVIEPSPQPSALGVVLSVMGAVVLGVLLAVGIVAVQVFAGL
jgi:hypothetical protein